MAITEKSARESGHIIHWFSPQFAQHFVGWKKHTICVLASTVVFASPPLFLLCLAYFFLGNFFADLALSMMIIAAFILVALLFSITIPVCEYLHTKLSPPYDWIVPGCIMGFGATFSLWLFIYIKPPLDPAAELMAHGSGLRPIPVTPIGIMVVSGAILVLVLLFNLYKRSKRKFLIAQSKHSNPTS